MRPRARSPGLRHPAATLEALRRAGFDMARARVHALVALPAQPQTEAATTLRTTHRLGGRNCLGRPPTRNGTT